MQLKQASTGRRAVLASLLSLGGYLVARPFLIGGEHEVHQWLEIVQDKHNPAKWYVNLYEGSVLGQLETSVLKSHRIEFGDGRGFGPGKPGYPARVWFANGQKEQSF